ncbi:hypothetical protein [Photorhabdus heterorhabditis]|nr:hypothetical protein [Photorhabdus heterorhabditis]NRN29561.1 hypothetical protein [Photorhabdus heterorhabditis subsp. aluminescens]
MASCLFPFIPFILQVAALLAAFTYPSLIVIYALGMYSFAAALYSRF